MLAIACTTWAGRADAGEEGRERQEGQEAELPAVPTDDGQSNMEREGFQPNDMSTKPPGGTRDFLPDEIRRREYVIGVVRSVYESYGFEPLETPAFENIETLLGKYGEEGDKLIFKILRRGEHEARGEADLALRYDLTVPLRACRRAVPKAISHDSSSAIRSNRYGGPTGRRRAGSASSTSATSMPSERHRSSSRWSFWRL